MLAEIFAITNLMMACSIFICKNVFAVLPTDAVNIFWCLGTTTWPTYISFLQTTAPMTHPLNVVIVAILG